MGRKKSHCIRDDHRTRSSDTVEVIGLTVTLPVGRRCKWQRKLHMRNRECSIGSAVFMETNPQGKSGTVVCDCTTPTDERYLALHERIPDKKSIHILVLYTASACKLPKKSFVKRFCGIFQIPSLWYHVASMPCLGRTCMHSCAPSGIACNVRKFKWRTGIPHFVHIPTSPHALENPYVAYSPRMSLSQV